MINFRAKKNQQTEHGRLVSPASARCSGDSPSVATAGVFRVWAFCYIVKEGMCELFYVCSVCFIFDVHVFVPVWFLFSMLKKRSTRVGAIKRVFS